MANVRPGFNVCKVFNRIAHVAIALFLVTILVPQSSQAKAHKLRYKFLYSFNGAPDGQDPLAGLVRDASGNLYGTTFRGGVGTCAGGCGVVFELSKTRIVRYDVGRGESE
jgi:uncharacterized repeat protein (TIGR03803 family)